VLRDRCRRRMCHPVGQRNKPRRAAPRRQRQALTAVWLGGRPRDVNLRELFRRIALFRCAIHARDRERALTGNRKGPYGLRDEDYLRLKILTCTLPDENTRRAKKLRPG
jgi:hypothetical protein